MRIIPAIDIIDGQCVRLTQGDYDKKKIYHSDPMEMAMNLQNQGFEYLHLVDLDGAKSSAPQNLDVLNKIALHTNMVIDFGGGIKSEDSLIQAIRSGAHQVNVGSLAVRNPLLVKFWLLKYGAEKIIISADVLNEKLAVSGWTEHTDLDIYDYINVYTDAGAKYFVCTDIAKDGMLSGSSVELYRNILNQFPDIKLIASGGVSSIDEMKELKELNVDGVIVGKALYENVLDADEIVETFCKMSPKESSSAD